MSIEPSLANDFNTYINANKNLHAILRYPGAVLYAVNKWLGRGISWIQQCFGTAESVDKVATRTLKKEATPNPITPIKIFDDPNFKTAQSIEQKLRVATGKDVERLSAELRKIFPEVGSSKPLERVHVQLDLIEDLLLSGKQNPKMSHLAAELFFGISDKSEQKRVYTMLDPSLHMVLMKAIERSGSRAWGNKLSEL